MFKITSKELRNKWIGFYESKGHVNIPAVSLIGDGKTGVMFNVAGMQPLMPYLLGEKHPLGTRLCNIQGCMRTVDIDSVGDSNHFTFFEMMGNWSLGDYFKKEKTAWSFEFLTDVLGLDKNQLCVSVFNGNDDVAKDTETANYLRDLGIKNENIFYLGKNENWWELDGTINTPCGPDNEWFYPISNTLCKPSGCDITCDCGRFVEIGNDVYMQYKKTSTGYIPLEKKNIDTGFGFDRMLMFLNNLTDGYKTDLFIESLVLLEEKSHIVYGENPESTKSMRILLDHTRTAVMLIGDINGIVPSNIGAGYILRRLIRRAIRHARMLGVDSNIMCDFAKIFINNVYNEMYPNLLEKENYIISEIQKEIEKFDKMLGLGEKEFEKVIQGIEKHIEFAKSKDEKDNNIILDKATSKDEQIEKVISSKNTSKEETIEEVIQGIEKHIEFAKSKDEKDNNIISSKNISKEEKDNNIILDKATSKDDRIEEVISSKAISKDDKIEKVISGKAAFRLFETFGFPLEMTKEMAKSCGYIVDEDGFNLAYEKHQELARTAHAGEFKGGLEDDGIQTTRLHTAVHLMNAGLRKCLGDLVYQRGSNITSERARFDFSYDKPMTKEQILFVEDFVNTAIKSKIPVICEEMSLEKAKQSGALGIFDSKYCDKVTVYTIDGYSKEICGGPHAVNTSELGTFKIVKECSSSSGVRRIKCILENN